MKCKKILASLFSLGLVLSPICVYADENDIVAQSEDGTQTYTDYSSAWNAALDGTNIVMTSDWNLSDHLVVSEGKTATIEMNGHKISRNLDINAKLDGEVIYVDKNATLNLNGNNEPNTNFSLYGFNEKDESEAYSLTSGGLITGGASTNGAGGIHMKKGSTMNLNQVAVAGNISSILITSSAGGGVYLSEDCSLNMKNSYVDYNKAKDGGGIYVSGSNVFINMNRSTISHNYAIRNGGAINSNCDATYVCMNKDSNIVGNYARELGGGIYFYNPYCQITSEDGLAEISENESGKNGGAAYFEANVRGNTAQVNKITFNSNSSAGNGGAIDMAQSNVRIEDCKFNNNSGVSGGAVYLEAATYITNCTFENNRASEKGGAIADFIPDSTIDNCTITNNHADSEGGGVYVYQQYDIALSGKVVIKDNKRSGDYADDLMLQKTWVNTAYVKGEVNEGSSVGIRTGDTGETKIGKDITSDCSQYFFLNDDGNYQISYEDGTLHKRSCSLVGSIFGNENLGVSIFMMIGIVVVGVACLVVHKKKNRDF